MAVCSGAAALIFETLWFRLAYLVFGNSVWASSLVLAAFMCGLGLGSFAIVLLAHKIKTPFLWYAWIEILVGVTGFGLVILLPRMPGLIAPLLSPLEDFPLWLNAIRFSLAFALMLVPSSLIGATLPVLVKAVVSMRRAVGGSTDEAGFGFALGNCYGMNTLGAMLGAVAGEMFLIERFGVTGTAAAAAGINLIAAGLLMGMIMNILGQREGQPSAAAAEIEFGLSEKPVSMKALLRAERDDHRPLVATFIAGGAFIALEVVWFRFMLLHVKGTAIAFAVMLSVILLGIGLGGLLASFSIRWLPGGIEVRKFIGGLGFLTGAFVVGSLWVFDPSLADRMHLTSTWAATAILSVQLMFPVSICSGALFVMLGRIAHERMGHVSGAAGLVTLANTMGGMFGALAGGFLLLPFFGIAQSLLWVSICYGMVTFAAVSFGFSRERWRSFAAVAGAFFVVMLVFFPYGMVKAWLLAPAERYNREYGTRTVLLREGQFETIELLRKDFLGKPLYYTLMTNGHVMAGTNRFAKRYMKLFSYWPAAMHPSPKSALVISYGLGSTARAMADINSITRIKVVDPSGDILDVSRKVYGPSEQDPLQDPRVVVHLEDGRQHLLLGSRKYDIITSEPPPPKRANIVYLYTEEYFSLMRSRLNEGGLVTYWLPAHEFTGSEVKSVIKSFCNVFDDCALWAGSGLDLMLTGSRDFLGTWGPVPDSRIRGLWSDPVIGPELLRIGLERPEQLGALFIADKAQLAGITQDALPLRDNYPKRLRKDDIVPSDYLFSVQLLEAGDSELRFKSSGWVRGHLSPGYAQAVIPYYQYQDIFNQLSTPLTTPPDLYPALHKILTSTTLEELPLWLFESDSYMTGIVQSTRFAPGNREANAHMALRALTRRDYYTTARLAGKMGDLELELFSLCMAGDMGAARAVSEQISTQPGDLIAEHNYRSIKSICGL